MDLTEEALVELNIYYGPNKVLDYVNLTNEDTGKTELVSRNHNWEGRQITRALHKVPLFSYCLIFTINYCSKIIITNYK